MLDEYAFYEARMQCLQKEDGDVFYTHLYVQMELRSTEFIFYNI